MDDLMVYVNVFLNCFRRAAFNAQSHKQFTVSASLSLSIGCSFRASFYVLLCKWAPGQRGVWCATSNVCLYECHNKIISKFNVPRLLLHTTPSHPITLTNGQFVSQRFCICYRVCISEEQQQQQLVLCACIYQIVKWAVRSRTLTGCGKSGKGEGGRGVG